MPDPYRTPATLEAVQIGPRWATEWQKVWVLLMRRLPNTTARLRWERTQARRGRLLSLFASDTWVQLLLKEMNKHEHLRATRPAPALPHHPGRPVDS